jgi:hypothetical protein
MPFDKASISSADADAPPPPPQVPFELTDDDDDEKCSICFEVSSAVKHNFKAFRN